MKILKYLLAFGISIVALICSVLHAETGTVNGGVLHVSATQAAQLLETNPDIKVLDVRTQWEYNRGHIVNAVQINYYSFGFKKALNALDKNITWIVHCKSGVRSGNILPLMKKIGFKSIIHMDDGFDGWRAAKLPISTTE